MLQDYDRTLELTQIAQNSAGRADEQFAKYSDTIEYQVNKLKNTWEEFRTSILDSSVLKGALAVAKELLSVVNGFFSGNIITTIPLIISLFTAIKGTKGVLGNIQDKITKKVNEYKEAVGKETEEQKEKQKEKNNFKEYGETAGAEIGKAMEASGKKVADEIRDAMSFSDDDTAEDVVDEAGNNTQNDTDDATEILADTIKDAEKEKTEKAKKANADERQKDEKSNEDIRNNNAETAEDIQNIQTQTADSFATTVDESIETSTESFSDAINNGGAALEESGEKAGDILVEKVQDASVPTPDNSSENRPQQDWIQRNAKVISRIIDGIQIASVTTTAAKAAASAIHEAYKAEQEEAESRLAQAAKEMSEEATIGDAVQSRKATEKLEKAVKSIETLQNRSFRTQKEEEELTSAISLLNDDYSELVKSYDENTGKIELLTEKIDEEIDAQQRNNELYLQRQVGNVAGQRSEATSVLISDLSTHDYGNGWLSSSSNAKNAESYASIAFGASTGILGAALGAKAGGALGTIVGSVVPVLGNIIGGVAGTVIGGALGALYGSAVASQYESMAAQTYNSEEFLERINSLNEETRSQIFDKINEQYNETINSYADLANFLDKNENKLAEVASITTDILKEIRIKQKEEDLTRAENLVLSEQANFGTKENPLYLSQEQWTTLRNSENITSEYAKSGSKIDIIYGNSLKEGETSFVDDSVFLNVAREIDAATTETMIQARDQLKSRQRTLQTEFSKLDAEDKRLFGWIGENNWTAIVSALEGEYGDNDEITKAVDAKLNELAKNTLRGIDTEHHVEDIADIINTLPFGGESLYNFFTKYFDFTDEANQFTLDELQAAMQEDATSLSNRDWGANSNQIQEWISRQINPEVNKAYKELVDTVTKNQSYLLSVFDESTIKALSIAGTNLWAEYAQTIANSPQKDFIFKTFNDTINNLPNSIKLNTQRFREVGDFIVSTLIPEKMDAGTLGGLTNQLEKLTGDAELANKVVYGLWDIWKNNGIKTATMDMSKFNEAVEASTTNTKNLISALGTLKSTFEKSITKEGLGGSDILSLLDAGLTDAIGENGEYSFIRAIDAMLAQSKDEIESAQEIIKDAIASGEDPETSDKIQEERINLLAIEAESRQKVNEIFEMGETLEKNATDATEKYTAALKSERDAVKKLEDAQKAQYEAYYGSEFYVPSLDPWFNFDSILKRINNDLDEQSSELKTIKTLSEAIDVVDRQNAVTHEKAITNAAEQVEMEKMIYHYIQQANDLLSGVAAFENGAISVDWGLLNNTRMPDAQKEEAIRAIQDAEKLTETWRSRNKENAQIEQDFNNQLKENLQKRVAFQEKGAEILKAAADKEVETQKNKYDALKKADDDYLNALSNAIEKQRRLRDQENALDDLAQKEKQLALMRRDTSGSQQKQIQSLEKDVEKSRQDVLDKTVDDIIQTLKDEAEKRDEERQAIIEATEAVNEATNFVKEFNEISRNWTTEQEALNWFNSISPNLTELTPEQVEAQQNEFTQTWNEQLPYLAQQQLQVTQFAQATTDEVTNALNTISNNAQFASDTATAKVLDNIEKEKIERDNAVLDAEEALKKVRDEIEETKKAQDDAVLAYNNYLNAMNAGGETAIKNYLASVSDSVLSIGELTIQAISNMAIEAMQNTINVANQGTTAATKIENYQSRYNSATNDYMRQGLVKAAQDEGYYFSGGTFSESPISGPQTFSDYLQSDSVQQNAQATALWGKLDTLFTPSGVKQLLEAKTTSEFDPSNYSFAYSKGKLGDDYTAHLANFQGYKYRAVNNKTNEYYVFSNKAIADELKGKEPYFRVEELYDPGLFGVEQWKKYATGGLVNYTGPAWVDGSVNRPEAFLSSEDTRRIGEAAKLFALSPILNPNQPEKVVSSSIGDTTVEININIENISDDYDVDQLVNRVHQDILDAARPTGASVILNKR